MASFMLHLVIGLLFTIASVLAVPAAGTCTAANRLAIVHLLFDNVFAGNTAAIYITPAADNITIAFTIDGVGPVTLPPGKPTYYATASAVAVFLYQGDNVTYSDDASTSTVTVDGTGHVGIRAIKFDFFTAKFHVLLRFTPDCLIGAVFVTVTDIVLLPVINTTPLPGPL